MEQEQIFHYVVRVGDTYAVWSMTQKGMAHRTDLDSTLADRLFRSPFTSRAEADECRNKMNAGIKC